MRLISSRRVVAVLGLAFLGLIGCSSDNDAAVRDQAKATAGTAVKEGPPMPKTETERLKMMPPSTQNKASGYPGAKR
jgi:hypothetical protein